MIIKVGSRVYERTYYGELIGTVIAYLPDTQFPYRVKWDDSRLNTSCYKLFNLELIPEPNDLIKEIL